jgi:hypothetical protein
MRCPAIGNNLPFRHAVGQATDFGSLAFRVGSFGDALVTKLHVSHRRDSYRAIGQGRRGGPERHAVLSPGWRHRQFSDSAPSRQAGSVTLRRHGPAASGVENSVGVLSALLGTESGVQVQPVGESGGPPPRTTHRRKTGGGRVPSRNLSRNSALVSGSALVRSSALGGKVTVRCRAGC